MTAQLRIDSLAKSYGGVAAVVNVSLEITAGEFVGLIGPNGSGKTTLFDCVTGVQRPDAGEVMFRDRRITRAPHDYIAREGLVRTFQLTHVFPEMTASENVVMAIQQHQEDQVVRRILAGPSIRRFESAAQTRARELIDMVGLSEKAGAVGGSLSYGQQKLLSVAMALGSEPAMICLDEPASGITQRYIERVADTLLAVNAQGTTVLLIEHNLELVMQLAHRVIVLERGSVIASGEPQIIREDSAVINAYLGGDIDA